MNSTQDVILGVLGTQWERTRKPGVEVYLESINRSGFRGRKVMLCWDIHPETRVALFRYGFEVIDLPSPPDSFFHARMRVCWEYLRDHHQEFRYIFWLDVKDLVLQSNPSDWMERNIGSAKLIASTECVTIEQEETNQLWARNILGEDKYQAIKNEEVINGGTWAGESETMTEVFHQVHLGCQTYGGGFPPCQIWINYIMRQFPFKEVLRIPRWSEGFAACLHPMWSPWRVPCRPYLRDKAPVFNINTSVLYPGTEPHPRNRSILFNDRWGMERMFQVTPTGVGPLLGVECVDSPQNSPFCIVHGYDRDWDMKEFFEFKYSTPGVDFSLERFKVDRELRTANVRGSSRLRRPGVQETYSSSNVPQTPRIFRRRP
jgi:hypothetical protein